MNIKINNDDINLSNLENKDMNNEYIKPVEKKTKTKTKTKKNKLENNNKLDDNKLEDTTNDLLQQELLQQQILQAKQFSKIKKNQSLDSDDIVYKSNVINLINQYYKIFSKFLTKFNLKDLEKLSIEELDALLIQIKDVVATRNIENNFSMAINYFPCALELTGKKLLNLNLDGYSSSILQNEEYYYTVYEILLDSNIINKIKLDPKIRLAYILSSSMFLVHTYNTNKLKDMDQKLNSSIDPSKFNDI